LGALTASCLIFGFLGWLVAKAINREEPPKWPGFIGVLIGVLFGLSNASASSSPEAVLTTMEQEEPFYRIIREKYPEEYARVRGAVEKGVRSGNRAGLRSEVRAIVLPLIETKFQTASSANLEALAKLVRDQARLVGEKRPDLCDDLLLGKDIGIETIVSRDIMTREMELYAALLEGPDAQDTTKLTQTELERMVAPMFSSLSNELDVPITELVEALEQRGPQDRQCTVPAELYDEILRAPPAKRDAILRTVFATT
jgi:hypothetical protein